MAFSLEMQRRPTHTDQIILQAFLLYPKKNTYKPSKIEAARKFSPVCMLLVQLASMNVFYSML